MYSIPFYTIIGSHSVDGIVAFDSDESKRYARTSSTFQDESKTDVPTMVTMMRLCLLLLLGVSFTHAFLHVAPSLRSHPLASYSSPRASHRLWDAAAAGMEAVDDGDNKGSSGDATVTASCFNLVKGIVGAGVLSLPAGVAAFGK